MSETKWLTQIKNAKKTCIIQNKIRKVHYLFPDEKEMVEEYSMETNVLLRRVWKIRNDLGGEGKWDVEIGDPEPKINQSDSITIAENRNQPYVLRRITKRSLEWRIQNLPYPIDTYSVNVDTNNRSIIVSTSNKKYYKNLTIPELERVGLQPEQNSLEFTHRLNTLVILYKKPKQVIELENAVFEEIRDLKPVQDDNCKTS